MATPVGDSIGLTGLGRDALIQGSSWALGPDRTITYSLWDSNFGSWDTYSRSIAAEVFQAWSDVANIDFQYVDPGGSFPNNGSDFSLTFTGYLTTYYYNAVAIGIFPDADFVAGFFAAEGISRADYPTPEGDIFLDNYSTAFRYSDPGGSGFAVALHEVGHALGLKHPHDDGGNSRPTFAQAGLANFDSQLYTIMSYGDISSYQSSGHPSTPMVFDIVAIQHIYGANTSHQVGNNTYSLDDRRGEAITIWDAGGRDTITAEGQFGDLHIDLREGEATHDPSFTRYSVSGTIKAIAVGTVIEDAIGGRGGDTIYGNDADNHLAGADGNDVIYGGAGADTLVGGDDGDKLFGGAGNDLLEAPVGILDFGGDSLFGGDGVDIAAFDDFDADQAAFSALSPPLNIGGDAPPLTIRVRLGFSFDYRFLAEDVEMVRFRDGLYDLSNLLANDLGASSSAPPMSLVGTGDVDTLTGGDGSDTLVGGGRSDWLIGAAGHDRIEGEGGDDSVWGMQGNDFLEGGAGDDRLFGNASSDSLLGGPGDDLAKGHLENDTLLGGDGRDELFGGADDDSLDGGTGSDTVNGNSGHDTVSGGDGNDIVRGQGGRDSLLGGAGDDLLLGMAGYDTLDGGAGNDTLIGAQANDTLFGGTGVDRFTFAPDHGTDVVADFQDGVDRFVVSGGYSFGDLNIISAPGGVKITGISGTTVLVSNVSASQVNASDFDFA